MSCYHPHYALDLGLNSSTGRHAIKFLPKNVDQNLMQLRYKYGEDAVLCLPCGHCVGCVLDYSKEWAVRCTLESTYYEPYTCWFITLTYAPEFVPDKLTKEPLQKFIKDIRNAGYKIKYFACGEHGDKANTYRPHYHILVFGLPINDIKIWSKSKGGYLFTSKFIESFWPFGFVTVAHSTFETAGYIARYCLKKRLKMLEGQSDDEFIIMSNGIGKRYLLDHKDEILKYDGITGKFGNSLFSSMPRYFEKLLNQVGEDISAFKDKRLSKSKDITRSQLLDLCYGHEEMLLAYKEDIKSHNLNYRRSL